MSTYNIPNEIMLHNKFTLSFQSSDHIFSDQSCSKTNDFNKVTHAYMCVIPRSVSPHH